MSSGSLELSSASSSSQLSVVGLCSSFRQSCKAGTEHPYFSAISFWVRLPMDIAATASSFVACENVFLLFFAIVLIRVFAIVLIRVRGK